MGGRHSVAVAVQPFHQSDGLTPFLRSQFYDQYSSDDILLQGHLVVLRVPYDIEKDQSTSFEINKFPKNNLSTFVSHMAMRETLSFPCGLIISSI